MAVAKLTDNQKKIIDDLKAEFLVMNKVEESSSGLIDVTEIIQTIELEKKFDRECELENNLFLNRKHQAMISDFKTIEGDLKKLNIEVVYPKNIHNGVYIRPIGIDIKGESYYNNLISYKPSHYIEKKLNNIERRINSNYSVGFDTHSSFDNKYKSFKEFISSNEFKEKLKMLYQRSIKK